MSFDSIAADANSADPMRQVDGALLGIGVRTAPAPYQVLIHKAA
jgi:hypothetical protein